MTILYSVLHALVDGVCVMAMFGTFMPRENGYFDVLLYNFCAFAMQMPFGVVLDMLNGRNGKRKADLALPTAVIGAVCTIAGAVTHPVVLGIGNALFHVGGGVGTIRGYRAGKACTDNGEGAGKSVSGGNGSRRTVGVGCSDNRRSGRGEGGYGNGLVTRLGIFVAPGALGLYFGAVLAGSGVWKPWFWAVSALMLLLCAAAVSVYVRRHVLSAQERLSGQEGLPIPESLSGSVSLSEQERLSGQEGLPIPESLSGSERLSAPVSLSVQPRETVCILTICCFMIVVILRSYIGMAVPFSWKTGVTAGSLSVLAVVGGKVAGGFAAARKGAFPAAAASLILAAVCYLFSGLMPAGLAALFFFNMTMPITLYWMVCAYPDMPGFAFGCLTFALFLGFVPVYLGVPSIFPGTVMGCAGSVISLLLLSIGIRKSRSIAAFVKRETGKEESDEKQSA